MSAESHFVLEGERFDLREAEAADVEALHALFSGNPEFLELRPDITAAGGYPLESVKRYWEQVQLDPVRRILVVVDMAGGEVVGMVDLVAESPTDGLPWIGLVLIRRDRQRRGLGAAAVSAVIRGLRAEGPTAVRAAVIEGNDAGLAFARNIGFAQLGVARTAVTGEQVLLMELPPATR